MSTKFPRKRLKIAIPSSEWTAIHRDVFTDALPKLSPSAQLVYIALYDRIWHTNEKQTSACVADLAGWTGLDARTISNSLGELLRKDKVTCRHWGTARSRSDKPHWKIEVAEFDLKHGDWTPIPRLLIKGYLPIYPRAILLLVLVWHQHLSWRNDCWPGPARLADVTGWSKRKIYQAIQAMSRAKDWSALKLGLPLPLEATWRGNQYGASSRHFRVRAVLYQKKKGRGYTTVGITEEFAAHFGIKQALKPVRIELENV